MRALFLILICSFFITSCEDVIEVELNDAPPRLVIEANLHTLIETGEAGGYVKLTTTAPFFDNTIPTVTDAIVQITDENGINYPFTHTEDGYYYGDLIPQQDMEYKLEVTYNQETFTATTYYVSGVPLEYVEQRNDGGFGGDQIELKVFYTDPAGEENFYYFIGSSKRGVKRDVTKDEFYDGNEIFGRYLADDLTSGDWVQFSLYGATEEFYNYMFILLQQTGGGGGPFETQPATVRGNITNETNPENYPLGYFRIADLSVLNYQVE